MSKHFELIEKLSDLLDGHCDQWILIQRNSIDKIEVTSTHQLSPTMNDLLTVILHLLVNGGHHKQSKREETILPPKNNPKLN